MEVVVVGGSFGGLTTAYELRRQLPAQECRITLVAKDRRFTFIPSLPWVTMGWRELEKISFDLEAPLVRKEIEFAEATVQRIDPVEQKVITDREEYPYDFLVLATGH
ncbi:MAG: FAD-dependent oxidoreductase, partial [Acidimicrobiia bacterium]